MLKSFTARLLVEDVGEDTDDEVKEVEAQPKTAAELANLKILFHRTPEGVGASGTYVKL